MRLKIQFLAALAAAFFSFSALAQDKAIVAEQTLTVQAPVVAVNPQTREVTLQVDGKPHVLKADDRIKNFDQIKAGDVLKVDYIQAVSIAMDPQATGRSKTVTVDPPVTADKGEKPGLFTSQTVSTVARVESLDAKAQTATLEGPDGNYVTVRVDDGNTFSKLKAGHFVKTTYTQAVIARIVTP